MTHAMPTQAPTRRLILTTRIPVRWGDMDAYGHVNNTVYFRYFEQARVEWLEQAGSAVTPDNPVAPVIINASCTFLIPVNYPSTVVVRMYAGEPGRSSVMTWYELGVSGDDRSGAGVGVLRGVAVCQGGRLGSLRGRGATGGADARRAVPG